MHFQRDFLLIHCKIKSEVSRHRINSLGLIVCEWYQADINLSATETCRLLFMLVKKLYRQGLSFSPRRIVQCTLCLTCFERLVFDEMQFPAGSFFISTMVSLCILYRMVIGHWSSSAGILRVYITTPIVGEPFLASDIPLQPSTVRNCFKGTGS